MKNKTIIKLFVWLFFAFFIPLSLGGSLMFFHEKNASRAALVQSIQRSTEALRQCVVEPMAYYAPQEIVRAAQLVALNENVVEVFAYSDVYETPLVHIEIPERRRGELFSSEEEVHFEGKTIGKVRITASMEMASGELLQRFKWVIAIFLGMFITGFLAMVLVFRKNVVRPLNRLLEQTRKISERQMEESVIWIGDDEFSRLGQTIEEMRLKLSHQFQEMHLEARTDDLTGISNRRDFSEKAVDALAVCRESARPFSLIMFDLDDFKKVNDDHGHLIGDQVLNKTSLLLQGNVRTEDLFARWGGEEFLLALPGAPGHRACLLAEKLRQVISSASYPLGLNLTASFGVAQAQNGEAFADLLDRVDQAMYNAKRNGKNQVVRYEEECSL